MGLPNKNLRESEMKTVIFFIVGAIVAELAIIALVTILDLHGLTLIVAVALLPVALLATAIIYLFVKFSKGEVPEGSDEGGDTDK